MELYEKVYIKSEDDLPKDEVYIVHHKRSDRVSDMDIQREGMSDDAKEFETNYWMNCFDWYLRPIKEIDLREELEKYSSYLYLRGYFPEKIDVDEYLKQRK
jgi:hypothetical protein